METIPRRDLEFVLGAVAADTGVRVYVRSKYPWRGRLRFDRKRHRDYFHLPIDYARINQFPEWFTVETGMNYTVSIEGEGPSQLDGSALWSYEMTLKPEQEVRLTVTPE